MFLFGLKRLVAAVVVTPLVVIVGVVGLVDWRDRLCGPFDLVPGVDCPPLDEPATAAAAMAAGLGLVLAVILTIAAIGARRSWLAAVVEEGYPYGAPIGWRAATFASWFVLLAGVVVGAVLTAQMHPIDGVLPEPEPRTFPLIVTTVLLAAAALVWTSWRWRRIAALANRRAGWPVFRIVTEAVGAPGQRSSAGGYHPGEAEGRSGVGWGAGDGGGWGGDDGGRGSDGGTAGYPRDGSVYGDGPQHGTRSLADQQGGFYDDDHRDLRPPAEQPGNFYSSDPFGREPE